MKYKIVVPVALLFTVSFSIAQQKQIKRPDGKTMSAYTVDTIVQRLMDAAEVTGLQLGIVNDNKVAYVKSYGYKNKTANQLLDTASSFYAASLSKSLFAYLVMQLADQKIIDLDKPLYTYLTKPLPEYEIYKDLAGDDRWKQITARHCLNHTTGFPNWRQFNPRSNNKLEIFFAPGERYAYSGEGIWLLQFVIETITGKGLEEIAQQNVFKPLGMTHTSYIWQPSFEANFAVGHNVSEEASQKSKRKSANAAGSMETTAADYTRLMAAIMEGKNISKKSKEEMLSPQIRIYSKHQFPSLNKETTDENKKIDLAYGLGWGLFTTPYGNAFFKEGHIEGWQNYTIGFPGTKTAFVILTNSDNGESTFKELVEKLTGVTMPWNWEGYFPYTPTVKLSQETLQQFTGTYEGRLKAVVSLDNGRLKVASETVKLPKTNMYAINDHQFFLKVMNVKLNFVKGADGKIEKVILDDEGEHYELKKVQ
jgi:CubicO group peptidase (beta-lactamase class C family)